VKKIEKNWRSLKGERWRGRGESHGAIGIFFLCFRRRSARLFRGVLTLRPKGRGVSESPTTGGMSVGKWVNAASKVAADREKSLNVW